MFGFVTNFYRNIKYYFKNVSIHGLCTIFRGTYWPEMIFWIVIFLFAVQYFYGLIYNNLISFNNQPVVRTIDSTAYPINLIPFPAVTVCNYNIVYKNNTEPIFKLLVKNGVKEEEVMNFLTKLSFLKYPSPLDTKSYKKIYEILAQNGYANDSVWLENLAQPCSRLLKSCKMFGVSKNCLEMFSRSKGDTGFCCSFNSYLNQMGNTEYYTTAGSTNGLYLTFNVDVEQYVSPTYNTTGVTVLVHNKETFPSSDTVFFGIAEPGKHVSMKIIPEIFEVEGMVKSLPINSRQCWFENEGVRLNNVNYTFENCMDICKTNMIANICGCVPYYFQLNGEWRYCTLLDVPCLLSNYGRYSALSLTMDKHVQNKQKAFCECYPRCSGITYSGVIESLTYRNRDREILNITGASVSFRSHWCYKYTVSRSTTVESFIALVGGFFSLCMGGSLLSVCEILFYFLKSFFTKSSDNENKDNKIQKYPQLYWQEMRARYLESGNRNKNIVILKPQFQNS